MKINILTTRPNFFVYFFLNGLTNQLFQKKEHNIVIHDVREYGDSSYGGGDGFVLSFVPFLDCLNRNNLLGTQIFIPVLEGIDITQNDVQAFSKIKEITFLCGRYEGIDERIKKYVDVEFRISKMVINSSEIVVLFLLDAMLRFLYMNTNFINTESFFKNKNILDFPHYTKPYNKDIPEVLLSGHHKKIKEFRNSEQVLRTLIRLNPRLKDFNKEQKIILKNLYKKIYSILKNKNE